MRPKDKCFENKKYEAFIRKQQCLICGSPDVVGHHVEHARRNCYLLVPLCVGCHTFGKKAYHVLERRLFEEEHKINLDWEIINLLSEFINEGL